MISEPSSTNLKRSKFNASWLALLPTLPILSLLALGSLRWKQFHPQLRFILTIFVTTQLIASLFTPSPFLSLFLAFLRVILLLGLIGVGSRLQTRHLSWLLVGLVIVYLTAYMDAFLGQRSASLLNIRLLHPFLTPPSLGLAGAFGVLICLSIKNAALWWRLPTGLLALSVCVLSGSRAPLLGLAVGLMVILAGQKKRVTALILGGVIFIVITAAGNLSPGNIFGRYASINNSDRDLIWSNTISVIASNPLGGVGPYQLGESLLPPGQRCELWPSLESRGIECPPIITRLQGAWLIAHNLILHVLAETGLIGIVGYTMLLGLAIPLMLRSSSLIAGIGAMLLVASLVDNVLLIPSPFFAEVFWISLGIAQNESVLSDKSLTADISTDLLKHLVDPRLIGGVMLAVLVLYLFPLWTSLMPHRVAPTIQLVTVNGSHRWAKTTPYRTYVMLRGNGQYRVVLRGCLTSCRTLGILTANLDTATNHTWDGWIQETLPSSNTRSTEMRLELYPLDAPPISIQPLARKIWTVNLQ